MPSLHCLTIGYVSAPPGQSKPDEVLTVASPNLHTILEPGDDVFGYELTYALRRAERKTLDDEIRVVASITEVPMVEASAH